MKTKIFLMLTISAFAVTFAGCTASFTTSKDNANVANPSTATTSNTTVANKTSNTTAESEKPKTVVKDGKKPEGGTAITANKEVPVPADWVYFYDDVKGYGYSIPKGTTSENSDSNGFDVTSQTTPSGIDIFTLAYKDKNLTQEDLFKVAVSFLEGLGQKVAPIGEIKQVGDYYSVADTTTTTADGRKGKLRILVGTDVTDNYMMILGTDTDKFAQNEKIIDQIWGSFEMWSQK